MKHLDQFDVALIKALTAIVIRFPDAEERIQSALDAVMDEELLAEAEEWRRRAHYSNEPLQ
jgi:hypothetical protein